MMKYKRFTWKTEKLQHLDDEVIIVVDNANEEWKGHILNIVDMLNDLNDERMMYKTTIDKRIVELEDENEQLKERNEQLRNKLNVTALELVDEAISMGKAVEISEMNYHEFLEYRKKKGKAMELQR